MFMAGLVAASSLALNVARADSGCPPVDHGMVTAWGGRSSQVYYDLSGVPSSIRAQVEQAFAKWTAANQTKNGTNISFQPADASHPANYVVQIGSVSGVRQPDNTIKYAPSQTNMYGDAKAGVVTSAVTTIDLNNVRGGWFDQSLPSFADAILKVMLHEIGHTMGLADVPVPDITANCGGQTARNSVMNGKCGVNDEGNNLPTDVTDCDNQTASLVGQVAGPGGGCTDNDGDGICAALDCDNDTVYDPTNCGQYPDDSGGGPTCYNEYSQYEVFNGGCYEEYTVVDTYCDGQWVSEYYYLSSVGPCVG
ncbi:MAG: hypothetical protein M3444_10500 [Acidobacteriota bacterium]|nr:hypothetical protein [Acidobacteriota bacterium]